MIRSEKSWYLLTTAALAWHLTACAPPAPPAATPAAEAAPPVATTPVVATPTATSERTVQHVIVVTVDGLVPETYLDPDRHGLLIPNLRRIVREGASSPGALSVFPSVTYPAHTSIASGVTPGRHGIVSNKTFDPLDENQDAWRWYDADVKVPRVWDVAREAGYTTALLDWPVTVGEQATFHVPEFWRAGIDEDIKLIDALSTPGLLAEVGREFPDFNSGFHPQRVTDEAGTDMAVHLIRKAQPNLMFLHVWQVDAAQHKTGLWSEQAIAAIEGADRQIGRLMAASEAAGIAAHTALVIASDHGFANVQRCVNPGALLREAGLLTTGANGKVSAWQAAVLASGGSAFVYLNDPDDAQLQQRVRAVFERARKSRGRGIANVWEHDEIVKLGGDPDAFLALEPELGTYFGGGVKAYETPASYRGVHGYDPNRPEMKASLLLYGAGISPGTLLDARLVDIAPTVAGWLGLEMPAVDGRQLQTAPTPAPAP